MDALIWLLLSVDMPMPKKDGGRNHIDRRFALLHGLHKQVGAIYLDLDRGRDSSLENLIIGPGDWLPVVSCRIPSEGHSMFFRSEMQYLLRAVSDNPQPLRTDPLVSTVQKWRYFLPLTACPPRINRSA